MNLRNIVGSSCYWIGWFLAYFVAIVAVGGLIGVILFPLIGTLFSVDHPVGQLALSGLKQLSFLFGIWAPAVSIVICVMRARSDRVAVAQQNPD